MRNPKIDRRHFGEKFTQKKIRTNDKNREKHGINNNKIDWRSKQQLVCELHKHKRKMKQQLNSELEDHIKSEHAHAHLMIHSIDIFIHTNICRCTIDQVGIDHINIHENQLWMYILNWNECHCSWQLCVN